VDTAAAGISLILVRGCQSRLSPGRAAAAGGGGRGVRLEQVGFGSGWVPQSQNRRVQVGLQPANPGGSGIGSGPVSDPPPPR